MPLDLAELKSPQPDRPIFVFETLGSTMTKLLELAKEGYPHGTVVLADEQTAGVGRLGRSWISTAGVGIYCSVLLRLGISTAETPLAALGVGLAAAEAIQQQTGFVCDLRWPNDVLIRERKVAGILAQLQEGCIITGIGINVNHRSLPDDLRTPATSLYLQDGKEHRREPLILGLIEQLDLMCSLLEARQFSAVLDAFSRASSYVADRRVVYETDQRKGQGVTAGLDANGFLKIREPNGRLFTMHSGSVRPDLSMGGLS